MSLKAAIVAGLCAAVHHGFTEHQNSMLPEAAILILSVVVIRFWYLHKKASNLAKTKITLTEEYLIATGQDARQDWKVRITNLKKATLISETAKKKSLVVTTSGSSFVLRGLEDPEKLMCKLPQQIQIDTTEPEQKLHKIGNAIFDCKDAEEVEALRDAKQLQARVQEALSETFPEAHVLTQDFSQIKSDTKLTMMIVGIVLIFAYLGYPQISLPLLPIAIFAYLPGLLSIRRTVDCLYVFSADALYELDRKTGTVHTISLNRVANRKSDEEDGVSLFIDNRVHLPVHIEKTDAEYIKKLLG